MHVFKSYSVLSIGGIAILLTGSVGAAAASGSDGGTITYTIKHIDDQKLANDYMLSRDQYKGLMIAKDPATPFDNAAHNCLGSLVVNPGRGPPLQINGVCDGVDKDGDVFWMWFHDEGNTHTWSFMGGTGKFDGLTGEGTTSQISAGPNQLVIGWEGSWKMK